MRPHFAVASAAADPQAVFNPPPGFFAAGEVTEAHFTNSGFQRPAAAGGVGASGAADAGIGTGKSAMPSRSHFSSRVAGKKFEAHVHAQLDFIYRNYRQGPWVSFSGPEQQHRLCQPDALIIEQDLNRVLIVEIKAQHTTDAWWQLRKKYEPVVRVLLPLHTRVVEICDNCDTSIAFPEPIKLITNLEEVDGDHFYVLPWR